MDYDDDDYYYYNFVQDEHVDPLWMRVNRFIWR